MAGVPLVNLICLVLSLAALIGVLIIGGGEVLLPRRVRRDLRKLQRINQTRG